MSSCTQSCTSCGLLYLHSATFTCVERRCIPCLYKVFPLESSMPVPNQRPEQCFRAREFNKSSGKFCGIYSQQHRLLTVGDGDFSFSLSLMKSGKVRLLTATSYESFKTLASVYPSSVNIISELASIPGATVIHGVDAANLGLTQDLQRKTFDVIIWNFPCVRADAGADGQVSEIEVNKQLLHQFFRCVGGYLRPEGPQEVHITHKTMEPFSWWKIVDIAQEAGLHLVASVVFDRYLYPGYVNRKALDKKSFPFHDSRTFVFTTRKSVGGACLFDSSSLSSNPCLIMYADKEEACKLVLASLKRTAVARGNSGNSTLEFQNRRKKRKAEPSKDEE